MKLVTITGSDCSDDSAQILAPGEMSDEAVEQAVTTVVNHGIATDAELPDMLDELVRDFGFVQITSTYRTEVSWVEGS